MSATLVLGLLLAGPGEAKPTRKQDFPDVRVAEPVALSPVPGAEVRTSELTLMVAFPRTWEGSRVEVWLDGARVEPADAVVARAHTSAGTGVRMLGSMSTDGLTAGEHRLRFVLVAADGRKAAVAAPFTFRPYPCDVRFRVVDGTGAPLSARVAVFGPKGRVRLAGPEPTVLDPRRRDHELHSVFVHDGVGRARLPDRPLRFVATAGLRHDLAVAKTDGCPKRPVKLTLPEVLSTPGEVSADFHVHTAHSGDAFAPASPMLRNLAASGLDLAVISDHNHIIDIDPMADAVLGDGPHPDFVAGIEARLGPGGQLGHLNAFPLDPAAPPFEVETGSTAAWLAGWRARQVAHPHAEAGTALVLQLNHPRGIQFHPDRELVPSAHALFHKKGYAPGKPLTDPENAWLLEEHDGVAAVDFDAMEVLNRFSWRSYKLVRRDWFGLLRAGRRVTGTGNSDSHALAVELVGLPVNLLPAGRDADGEVDLAAVVEAVQGGRLRVSSGPLVDVEVVSGASQGGVGDTVVGRTLTVTATVQAAPWVPVPEVRLVVDGKVVEKEALPATREVLRGQRTWTLTVDRDAWLLVEAGWPLEDKSPTAPDVVGLYADIAPGYVPIGFTNPVWIDADGDGEWTPAE